VNILESAGPIEQTHGRTWGVGDLELQIGNSQQFTDAIPLIRRPSRNVDVCSLTDLRVDQPVIELYRLTEDEIKIVEEGTAS
jgi:hypothetical protein